MTTKSTTNATAQAIVESFISPNVSDRNWEPANVVDVLSNLAQAAYRVSTAISDEAIPGTDATGGKVGCLVEATMGVTAGLAQIADAISDLAQAVRETRE